MASSFIVELSKKTDNIESASPDIRETIGYFEFVDFDVFKRIAGTDESQNSNWKFLISLNENNSLCRQLWQLMKREGNRLPIVDFRALPERLEPLKGRVWVKPKGKICYTTPEIYLNDPKKSTRKVFQGLYEYDIPVAVQKTQLVSHATITEIEREFQILRQLENHENFIRYFCHEEDIYSNFVYIATELCTCSVADLYEPKTKVYMDIRQEILQCLKPKAILFQATRGLEYLHSNGYVHRNVKPSSFLIKQVTSLSKGSSRYVIKITDFRLSRNALVDGELSGTVASDFWEAPESRRQKQKLKPSLDVFILGCFFHYVLLAAERFDEPACAQNNSKHLHPFGCNLINIINEDYIVYQPEWRPTITNDGFVPLLKKMLNYDESKRPFLTQVLEHSFFQSATSKEYYPFYSYDKPGWCVIFNQESFVKPDGTSHQRTGSKRDCERLKETFSGLGYYVEVFDNQTSIELKVTINELARKVDLAGYGSLVVCLLSHGFEGSILCSDNVPVNISRLQSKFSLQKCPHLYGKPKVFIVQACRNTLDIDGGKLFSGTREKLSKKIKGFFARKTSNHHMKIERKAEGPPLLDFLTINATLPGSLACRNGGGSYFIQALCDALDAEYFSDQGDGEKRDLESVLRGGAGVQSLLNAKFSETDQTWQTMQWEACLTKYIRFKDCRSEERKQLALLRGRRSNLTSKHPEQPTEYDTGSNYELFGRPLTTFLLKGLVLIVPLFAIFFYFAL